MSSQKKSDALEAYQGSADEDEENVAMVQEPQIKKTTKNFLKQQVQRGIRWWDVKRAATLSVN